MDRLFVPVFDTRPQFVAIEAEIRAAVDAVWERSHFILSTEVKAFEREFAAYCGVDHAIGVGNGTDALELALRAVGVGPSDEVVTVALTAPFTALAIAAVGAVPVFVDVDPETLVMDPDECARAIGPATRAVVPVALYGRPCDVGRLREMAGDLPIVVDAAQAHGATWQGQRSNALGDLAAFSFYPTKNLGAYGDGGAVVTTDADLASRIRQLRAGGMGEAYRSEELGRNSRLDEVQAAVLRVKLRHLDMWNARRRTIARRYDRELTGVRLQPPADDSAHHLYVVRSSQRDALATALSAKGIGSKVHYPWPLHEQPAFQGRSRVVGELTHTVQACDEVLSLPLYPELTGEQLNRVIEGVNTSAAELQGAPTP